MARRKKAAAELVAVDARPQRHWFTRRLGEIEDELERRGLHRDCWQHVVLDWPDTDMPAWNQPEAINYLALRMIARCDLLRDYWRRYSRDPLSEGFNTACLIAMAHVLGWAPRRPQDWFVAGRLYEAAAAILNRRDFTSIDGYVSQQARDDQWSGLPLAHARYHKRKLDGASDNAAARAAFQMFRDKTEPISVRCHLEDSLAPQTWQALLKRIKRRGVPPSTAPTQVET